MAYSSLQDLVTTCEIENKTLPQVILENEMVLTNKTEDEIFAMLQSRYCDMQKSINTAIHTPQEMPCNLIKGQAKRQYDYSLGNTLTGSVMNNAMAMAFSASEVNASMGKICAAPTAGSCGILPAVISSVVTQLNLIDKDVISALLVAAGVGAVITKNATISGAEGGCQAECGTAAAMAAAACVELSGGSAATAMNAAGIALINVMGLVCDPVAGLVQLPCSFRNASGAVNALISADMALAGQQCGIPADEVVNAMYRVGKKLPMEFRETALGGIAAQPSAVAIYKSLKEQYNEDGENNETNI